jgi:hypothetical protein
MPARRRTATANPRRPGSVPDRQANQRFCRSMAEKRPPVMRCTAFSRARWCDGVALPSKSALRASCAVLAPFGSLRPAPRPNFTLLDGSFSLVLESPARTRARLSAGATCRPGVIYPGLSARRVAEGQGGRSPRRLDGLLLRSCRRGFWLFKKSLPKGHSCF